RPLLGGLCNIEEHRIVDSTSSGIALRCFDRSSGGWAIYWVSERDGKLEAPVYGGFEGDEGLFEGEDTDHGTPIKGRFGWRRLTPNWRKGEQAFPYAQGCRWESNWTMDFERTT